MFDHIVAKLDDKSIDILTMDATGYSTQDRHFIRRDDGTRQVISDHDYWVLMGHADEIHEIFGRLGLLHD